MINLVFDYDGTIHDPVKVFAPAFRETIGEYIVDHHGCTEICSDSHIASWFGVSMDIMMEELSHYVESSKLHELMNLMTENVRRRMMSGEQTFFPGVEKVLLSLKNRGFRLILFSKCDRPHINRQTKIMSLDELFDGIYCTGDFGDMRADKATVFTNLIERFPGKFIIIGDRKQDIDIAQRWGLASIGCLYGYGTKDELDGATALAGSVSDIPDLIDEIVNKFSW